MLSCISSTSGTYPSIPLSHTFFFSSHSKKHRLLSQNPLFFKKPKKCSIICLRIGIEQIAEIAQNKVLIAATLSSAIGQLSKPFTSALLYDTSVDFKASIRSGGFPSTHSAGVVAAATSLGLERGFSDSIFGMTVVFASIVMYDAQGVRREAGNHAKVLNGILLHNTQNYNDDLVDSNPEGTSSSNSESLAPLPSLSEKATTSTPNATNSHSYFRPENKTSLRYSPMPPPTLEVDVSSKTHNSIIQLKETIGHTEREVIAGAVLGFLVSLAVYTLL